MEDTAYELETLTKYTDYIVAQKPHSRILLQAFLPLFIEKFRFLQALQGQKQTFPVDRLKFENGVSLIQQCQFFHRHDPWKRIATSAASAIAQGFPALKEDMRLLAEQIESGDMDCHDLFQNSSSDQDDLKLMTWAVRYSISSAALGFFLKTVEHFLLCKRATDMKDILAPLPWSKGYCPVCASMPMLAITREQGRQWLQCSRCSHEWMFARLTCPACNHPSPEDTTYLHIEGNPDEKVFVCENCGKYLITTHQDTSLLTARCPEVLAISLAHLDLILQGKGYDRMAVSDWNTL